MVTVETGLTAGSDVGPIEIDAWLEAVASAHGTQELPLLQDACRVAAGVYRDEATVDDESRMRHALSVADILAKLDLDQETLTAAILNGVLDCAGVTRDILEERFGRVISNMVEDLARIRQVVAGRSAGVDEAAHAENRRRLLLGIAEDVRVVLVVVAERLHRMRMRKKLTSPEHRRLARETLDIYAPLANRLGIWNIKWEMEDLCLRCLEPEEYNRIASLLDERREDRERGVADIAGLLGEKLADMDINADIMGRPKHIYSIRQKMKRKDVGFDRIFDVRAVRVLVDTVTDCYAALGVVHGLWQNIPGEFDDYIASPKTNLYQSLHTAVTGPEGRPVEIQIRTRDMHYHSEMGVAAHWRYKEDSRQDAELERRVLWMRRWLELKDAAGGAREFAERFKAELEPAQIYVLTPQAKVIELPKGSTPLDFAYAIHSDVGHRCRGARVNGRIVQLTRPLKSGETVEILTTKEGGPSRDWLSPHLGYLRSARARNKVRQWFKREDYDEHVQKGRGILERELGRLSLPRPDLEAVAGRFNLKKGDDLLAAIGRGEVSAAQVAGSGDRQPAAERKEELPVSEERPPSVRRGDVAVAGVDDLMTHMARCCKPVPNDTVVGFITRGRGVSVHRRDCPNVAKLKGEERERLVDVIWTRRASEVHYPVDILVRAEDRKGLLRDVSTLIANEDVDVTGANTVTDRKADIATMRFTVVIADIEQLGGIVTKISELPGVIEVRRKL